MKRIFLLSLVSILMLACGSSKKNYLHRSNEERALLDAVKQLDKNPDDYDALEAVPLLYSRIKQYHLQKINDLKSLPDNSKWDKILSSYNTLQNVYQEILNTPAAYRLVTPDTYAEQILETKQAAAESYYNEGESLLALTERSQIRKAYNAYNKAIKYIPDYKDSEVKKAMAFEKATIMLVVKQIRDNSYFVNSGWGSSGFNYSNEYFQDRLVRDLSREDQPLKVYTDWQARRDNVDADWELDLYLREINIPYPQQRNYTRQASNRIEIGTDTSGRPVYQTVYATIHITERSFTARGVMDVDIRDIENRKSVNYSSFREEYRWRDEVGSFTGDSRALSAADWNIINNRNSQTIRKEDVLEEIYRKLYPRVLSYVRRYVEW